MDEVKGLPFFFCHKTFKIFQKDSICLVEGIMMINYSFWPNLVTLALIFLIM